MGIRSINTTKSGKYINPTDQARKQARKKELKKNKKQRQLVRTAVLMQVDPHQVLSELEEIDQLEYNVDRPSNIDEKSLQDKRKKLRITLERVLKMYQKEDPHKWSELKQQKWEYERKRNALYNFYESVKAAQEVQVEDIPLPVAPPPPESQAMFVGVPSQIPLPGEPVTLPSNMPSSSRAMPGPSLPPGPMWPPYLMQQATQPAPPLPSSTPPVISKPPEKVTITISGQPKLRNLAADVTRFVPTSLMVKRENKRPKFDPNKDPLLLYLEDKKPKANKQVNKNVQNKDEAYNQFMKEMEVLL